MSIWVCLFRGFLFVCACLSGNQGEHVFGPSPPPPKREKKAKKKLQIKVIHSHIVKRKQSMQSYSDCISHVSFWAGFVGGNHLSPVRTRVFPVGKQLERLNTLKPTGDLLPKRRHDWVDHAVASASPPQQNEDNRWTKTTTIQPWDIRANFIFICFW